MITFDEAKALRAAHNEHIQHTKDELARLTTEHIKQIHTYTVTKHSGHYWLIAPSRQWIASFVPELSRDDIELILNKLNTIK